MTQLVEYLRGTPKRRKLGVLFAEPVGETNFAFGYSLCNKEDEFDRDFGLWLAEKRADKFVSSPPFSDKDEIAETTEYDKFECADGTIVACRHSIPDTVLRALPAFMARCKAYYKEREAPYWYQLISTK